MEPEPRRTETDAPETVECRYPRAGYALAGMLLFFAVVIFLLQFTGTKNGEPIPDAHRPIFWTMAAMLLLPVAHVAQLTRRSRLVADVDGLRYRGAWRDEQFFPWGSIRDYYVGIGRQVVQGRNVLDVPTLVFDTGKKWGNLADFEGLDDFKRVVAARATASRADRWERLGVRPFDPFPRTFRYWNRVALLNAIAVVGSSVLLSVGVTVTFWLQTVKIAEQIGWSEATPSVVVTFVLGGAFGLLPLFSVRVFLDSWKRRGETITVTPETLRYDNAATGETLQARWADVEDFFYRADPKNRSLDGDGDFVLVLRGADEKQIAWRGSLLLEGSLLRDIVARYALPPRPTGVTPLAEPDATAWRKQNAHAATGGSDPATWASGAVGVGDRRVFRHRSPFFAGILRFGVLLMCLFFLAHFSAASGWTKAKPENVSDMLWLNVLTAVPVLWGWVCYRVSRVETDDIGITQYHPFGKRYLPWFAVATWDESAQGGKPFDHLRVHGRNGVILRLFGSLLGYDELRGELEKYAPPVNKPLHSD